MTKLLTLTLRESQSTMRRNSVSASCIRDLVPLNLESDVGFLCDISALWASTNQPNHLFVSHFPLINEALPLNSKIIPVLLINSDCCLVT